MLGTDSQSVARTLGLTESSDSLPERCPVTAVGALIDAVGDKALLARSLSPRVLRRRTGCLAPIDSNRLYRATSAWLMALYVFGSRAKALRFCSGPHAMLRGATPLETAAGGEAGLEEVQALLGRLYYGTGG